MIYLNHSVVFYRHLSQPHLQLQLSRHLYQWQSLNQSWRLPCHWSLKSTRTSSQCKRCPWFFASSSNKKKMRSNSSKRHNILVSRPSCNKTWNVNKKSLSWSNNRNLKFSSKNMSRYFLRNRPNMMKRSNWGSNNRRRKKGNLHCRWHREQRNRGCRSKRIERLHRGRPKH